MAKLERAFMILERLASGQAPPTHAELMRELGVQRSTLSDSLAELRDLGFVAVRDRRYLPGARLLTFVRRAALRGDLAASVRPALERLARATGETAIYVIEDGGSGDAPPCVVSVDQVESPRAIRYVGDIGAPYPMHTTAAGQAFLAFGGRDAPPPPGSGIDAATLERELDAVRERGYAITGDETRSMSIAAPVRDVHGTIVGVICITGPSERVSESRGAIWAQLRHELDRLDEA